jgi:hypothetical protein
MTEPNEPLLAPDLLAALSIQIGCSSADRGIEKIGSVFASTRQNEFLEEMIFFHHFTAMTSVFRVTQNMGFWRVYCQEMTNAIDSGPRLLNNEEVGIPPLKHYSTKNLAEAIKKCFFSFANILACQRQGLYLQRKPSDSEVKVMNTAAVQQMAEWDSPSVSPQQYLTAALWSRLSLSLEVEPNQRPGDFMQLGFFAAAESKASFEHYCNLIRQ